MLLIIFLASHIERNVESLTGKTSDDGRYRMYGAAPMQMCDLLFRDTANIGVGLLCALQSVGWLLCVDIQSNFFC